MLMNGFKIIALLILAVGLYHNYQQDAGSHRKAKVWQALCLALLVQAYASIFGQVGWAVSHWAAVQQKFGGAVGYVPGGVHLLLYWGHLGLALLTLLTAVRMVNRVDAARRRLLRLLPLLVVVETFSFYRGWLGGGAEVPLMHGFILALGLAFNGALALALALVYRSGFMRAFYQTQPRATFAVAEPTAHAERIAKSTTP
jgi:hypothetical protein